MMRLLIGFALLAIPLTLMAGNLDSPAPPSDPASSMYTLEDIYNRLTNGAAGAPRSGVFSEPNSGPGATGHDLNEIMNLLPKADDINGLSADDVACGKTFWGLRTDGSGWGPQVGTVQCPGVISVSAQGNGSISPSGEVLVPWGTDQTFTFTSDAGYYIRDVLVDGLSVGIVGSYTFSNVTANHSIEVLFGLPYTIIASVDSNGGTIQPQGSISVIPGNSQTFTFTPDAGYHVYEVFVDNQLVKGPVNYTVGPVLSDHTITVNFLPGTGRYIINGNGTVTDSQTGVIWLRNANCFGVNKATNAEQLVANLADGQCGLTDGTEAGDWRLPTRSEFLSIINNSYSSPCLANSTGDAQWSYGDAFFNVPGGYSFFWTSSMTSSWRYYVTWFPTGCYVNSLDNGGGTNVFAWPVRNAQ